MNTEESYGALIVVDGKYLASKSPSGYWSIPKGHIQEGETPQECAKRECLEEVGLKKISSISDKCCKESYFNKKWKVYKTVGLFIITTEQRKFELSKEVSEIKLLEKEEFIKQVSESNFLDSIKECIEYFETYLKQH